MNLFWQLSLELCYKIHLGIYVLSTPAWKISHTSQGMKTHTHTVESSFLYCVTSMSFSPITTLIKLDVDITQDDHGKLFRNGIQKFQFVNFPTFPESSLGKESACNAGDTKDTSLIPGLGRSFGEGNGYPFQYFFWRIPWTEESGKLQSMGSQRVQYH